MRIAAPPSPVDTSDRSYDSDSSSVTSDGSQEPDPYLLSSDSHGRQLRPNRWRGSRPNGKWRTVARGIDFSSSTAIESSIKPYSDPSGERYGQLPFPLSRLETEDGSMLEDKIECYRRVTLWRKMMPKEQQREWDRINRAARKQQKKAQKQQKEADRAARKRASADKRNKNKRDKRRANKNAASSAGTDADAVGAEGDADAVEEETGEV